MKQTQQKAIKWNCDEGDDGIEVEEGGSFCWQSCCAHLTYKTHLNKAKYVKWANDISKEKQAKIVFIRLAHETADEKNPYLHTHVVIEWKTAPRWRTSRCFDYNGIHPNIKKVKDALHKKRVKNYIAKEDPDNADLIDPDNWTDTLLQCESKGDVVRLCKRPVDLAGLLTAYEIVKAELKLSKIITEEDLSKWQWRSYQIMNDRSNKERVTFKFAGINRSEYQPDWNSDEEFEIIGDRTIGRDAHVVYNPEGDSGKSRFINYLMECDPLRFFAIQGVASARDVAQQILGALDKGWSGDTLLINLTRQCADYKIYAAIEMCIDGFITTQKWAGVSKTWTSKNVWIFTNFMPNLKAMSMDRWNIFRVRKVNSELRPMTIPEALRIYKEESLKRKDGYVSDEEL